LRQDALAKAEAKLLSAENRHTIRAASALGQTLRIRAEAAVAEASASRDRLLLLEQLASMSAELDAFRAAAAPLAARLGQAEAACVELAAVAQAADARADEAEVEAAETAEAAWVFRPMVSQPRLVDASCGVSDCESAPASPTSLMDSLLLGEPAHLYAPPTALDALMSSLGPHGKALHRVTKLGVPWRGKYRRTLVVSAAGVATLDPSTGGVTNRWAWLEVLDASPVAGRPTMLRLAVAHHSGASRAGSLAGSLAGSRIGSLSGSRIGSLAASCSDSAAASPYSHSRGSVAPLFSSPSVASHFFSPTKSHQPALPMYSGPTRTPTRAGTHAVLGDLSHGVSNSRTPLSAPAAVGHYPGLTRAEWKPLGAKSEMDVSFWKRLVPTGELVFESASAAELETLLRQLRLGLAASSDVDAYMFEMPVR